jgi:hypothetical protein
MFISGELKINQKAISVKHLQPLAARPPDPPPASRRLVTPAGAREKQEGCLDNDN